MTPRSRPSRKIESFDRDRNPDARRSPTRRDPETSRTPPKDRTVNVGPRGAGPRSEIIAVTLGDVTGIGPEVALKAIASELRSDRARYVIVGDGQRVRSLNAQLGLDLPFDVGSAGGRSSRR